MGYPLLYNLQLGLLESKGIKVELAFSKPARICSQDGGHRAQPSEAGLQRIPDLLTPPGIAWPVTSQGAQVLAG